MAGINDERVFDGMSNQQFDVFIETLAQLIEAKAESVEDAARLVREAKTNPKA